MKITKKLISLILCAAFIFAAAAVVNAAEVEYATFGSYPKSEVQETSQLKAASYDQNGDAIIGDAKYRRVKEGSGYRYFLYEPVVWQKCGNTLIATEVIDCKMYDEQEVKIKDFMGGIKYADSVTWEECSIRGWLNGDFAETAFTQAERDALAEEVRLVSLAEAKATEKSQLCRNATDFAVCMGIEPKDNNEALGNCEWFLQDISPLVSSTVCTVRADGTINTGMTVLVNEEGIGVVPCITVKDGTTLDSYMAQAPTVMVELYRPGGCTQLFAIEDAEQALANGWYNNKDDAKYASGIRMGEFFKASGAGDLCKWKLSNLKGQEPVIRVDAPKENMTIQEIITFLKPIMDALYTGNQADYVRINISFYYGKQAASSFDEFTDTVSKQIHDAASTCWSGWGNLICSDVASGNASGMSGEKYSSTLKLKINGDGVYSVERTDYYRTLYELAGEAKKYSSNPAGQLQYLRRYFGQNTIYDGRQFNNEPNTLITKGVGICGTYANFAADFCKILGIPCLVLKNDKAAHAWNGVFIDGKWYHMDHTGSDDKEFMRNSYSNYTAYGEIFEFDPSGFPEGHNVSNVSFFSESYMPVDDISPEDLQFIYGLFANGAYVEKPVQNGEISVIAGGKKLEFDVAPVLENGRTLVPMRKIFEALGATVYWNDATRTVTGVKESTVITVTVDSTVMTRNGQNISLDVPPRLIDSRTLVPVRVIAESFGLTVDWDDATQTVKIY